MAANKDLLTAKPYLAVGPAMKPLSSPAHPSGFSGMWKVSLRPSKLSSGVHTYIHTGFIGIWQPEAGLNKHTHIDTLSVAERHNVDAMCLQKTHVDVGSVDRFKISGFDLISYNLHAESSVCEKTS